MYVPNQVATDQKFSICALDTDRTARCGERKTEGVRDPQPRDRVDCAGDDHRLHVCHLLQSGAGADLPAELLPPRWVTDSARAHSYYSESRHRYNIINLLTGQFWFSKFGGVGNSKIIDFHSDGHHF